MIRTWPVLVGIAFLILLATPPLDPWLDRTMPRLLVLQVPAWLGLGWLAGLALPMRPRSWNPLGLTGLAFFVGSVAFWMIPRSVDATQTSELVDQLMHANLLVAGAGLAASRRSLPFVAKGALGIYGASMTFALGMIYTRYGDLLCGAFDLAQQRATGRWMLGLSPLVTIFVLVFGFRALSRGQAVPGTNARPTSEG